MQACLQNLIYTVGFILLLSKSAENNIPAFFLALVMFSTIFLSKDPQYFLNTPKLTYSDFS